MYAQRDFQGVVSIAGHTHRPESKCLRSTLTGIRSLSVVSGHLSDERLAGAYAKNHHWQRAFIKVEYSHNMKLCQPTLVYVEDNGSFMADGIHYR